MDVPLTIALVGASLLGGGLGGYRIGVRVRGRLRRYWALNLAAVLGCAALDLAAVTTGRYALGYSALGLMGGLITGLKYGYTDSLRVWPEPGPAETSGEAEAESPAEVSLGSEGEASDSAR